MASDARSVGLTVPAQADYLVLARLALSAVCRLTQLPPEDVADLKLAITEAAGAMVDESARELEFRFDLGDESLDISITGEDGDVARLEDELALAIIAATVDDFSYDGGSVRIVKYLRPRAG